MANEHWCRQCAKETVALYPDVCADCIEKQTGVRPVAEKEIPNFANFDEMMKFAEGMKGGSKKNPLPSTKKNATRKSEPDPSKGMAVDVPDEELIYQTIHFYTRKGDSWNQTLKDAKDEAQYRNSNVLLFAHEHTYKEACSDATHCRRIGNGSADDS